MKRMMEEERFSFITKDNKEFILAFDDEITKLGYSFGGNIGSGYCWGKFMIIYSKPDVKNKKIIARIYIRDGGIVLRLFLNEIGKHREYIESAPGFIKDVFTGQYGNCNFCENKWERCAFRKSYIIDDKKMDKCSGVVFEFWNPTIEKLPGYMNLLKEFYARRISKKAV